MMKILSSPVVFLLIVLIDINSAGMVDLTKIIHIGEARARELISLRPFSSLDDLDRIKGIGESRIADIKKQGLAWVASPILSEPQPQKKLATINQPTRQTPSFPLLIPAAMAIFSGITILFLKRKTKSIIANQRFDISNQIRYNRKV